MGTKLLSLEWDSQRLVAVEATEGQATITSTHAASAKWPAGLDFDADPEGAGEFLNDFLRDAGMNADRTVIAIPRKHVIVKHVSLHASSPNELPELMRLQAEGRAMISPEKLRFDYVPLPALSDSDETHALLVMLDSDVLQVYQTVAENAGLKVLDVGIAPVAATEVLNQSANGQISDCDLLLTRGEGRLEITAVSQEGMLASHSHVLDSNLQDESKVASHAVAAIRRFQAAVKEPTDMASAKQLWLLDSPENGAFANFIEEKLDMQVQLVDPMCCLAGAENRTIAADRRRYVGAIGMLLSNIRPTIPALNFMAPRRPQSNRKRVISALAASSAVVLLMALAAYLQMSSRKEALDREIGFLTQSELDLQNRNHERESALEAVGVVDEWIESDIIWLDKLSDLSKRLPANERTYLSSLRLEANSFSGQPKIKGGGYARDPDDVMNLNKELLKARQHYQIHPHGFQSSQRDKQYPTRFEFEVDLVAPHETQNSESDDG